MSAHTPKPWRYEPERLYDGRHVAGRGPSVHIGDMRVTLYTGRDDDARLIAAAPEMYEALKWASDYLDGWPADSQQRHCRETVRALLAKIDGAA